MRVTIEKLIHGGNGLATHEGRKLFVPFSAPGDVLEVELTAEHAGFAEARIVEVMQPSPSRVLPRCPVFGSCGGCQWQHISYEEQLAAKRAIVIEQLQRLGGIAAPEVLETLPSPNPWNYRNRIQLHVDAAGRVGYYRPRSREVVEFAECAIAEEAVNQELAARREEFAKRNRGVAIRASGGAGFSQVNSAQNERLASLLCEWLSAVPHASVLELYAGSGNFTRRLAAVAQSLVASEIDGRAVRAGQEALAAAGIRNVMFICMPAARAAKRHAAGADAVVVDPPRKGFAEAIPAIIEAGPRSILAISCDPATLARDCRALIGAGYRFVRCQPVDMFPQTFHVESLTLLERPV